jgi:acetyl esterase/lipase
MNPTKCTVLILLLTLGVFSVRAADPIADPTRRPPIVLIAGGVPRTDVLDVWPGVVPGEAGKIGDEKFMPPKKPDDDIQRLTNVAKPTLTIYHPAKEKDTGAAILICPGGGYSILAWNLEGTEVAEWLNGIGVTGIILKYRVPKRPDQPNFLPPLQDAQRAMSLVRSKAADWGIDPKRIGMLGFSAGGNLTARACTGYEKRSYETIDDVDQVSCRPDFGVLLYPAWLVKDKTEELIPELVVNKQTPPMFFVHAGNDGISAANSAVMYLALKRAGVPAELHVFSTGGHGFGLRPTTQPVSAWPKRCEDWLRNQNWLERKKD